MKNRNTIKRKSDIEFHSDGGFGWGRGHAALNVKLYTGIEDAPFPIGDVGDDGFTLAWIEEHLTGEQVQGWWDAACEDGWEDLANDAALIFGGHECDGHCKGYRKGCVSPYGVTSEGRSGGWCVVTYNGRPTFDREEVEAWNAIDLGKWRKFATWVDAQCADIPRATAWLIGANVYEPWREEQDRKEAIEYRSAISDGAVRTVAA